MWQKRYLIFFLTYFHIFVSSFRCGSVFDQRRLNDVTFSILEEKRLNAQTISLRPYYHHCCTNINATRILKKNLLSGFRATKFLCNQYCTIKKTWIPLERHEILRKLPGTNKRTDVNEISFYQSVRDFLKENCCVRQRKQVEKMNKTN